MKFLVEIKFEYDCFYSELYIAKSKEQLINYLIDNETGTMYDSIDNFNRDDIIKEMMEYDQWTDDRGFRIYITHIKKDIYRDIRHH